MKQLELCDAQLAGRVEVRIAIAFGSLCEKTDAALWMLTERDDPQMCAVIPLCIILLSNKAFCLRI